MKKKNHLKRLIAVFLCVVLAMINLPSDLQMKLKVTTPTYAISQSEVESKLAALIGQYVGTTWNDYYYGIQCKGFANLIFYKLFGVTYIGPYDSSTKSYIPNPSGAYEVGRLSGSNMSLAGAKAILQQAMPGDFIQVRRRNKTYGHSMIVVSTDANGVVVFDCNSDGANGVKKYHVSWSTFYEKNSAMSLYRANGYPTPGSTPDPTPDIHVPTFDTVRISSVDSSHIRLNIGVSNAGLVRVVAISKTTGEQTTTDFVSDLGNINYTFNTSSMTNPGKDFYIRIYAYTSTSGGNERLHEVTYGSIVGSVQLPSRGMLYHVDKTPSDLITTGRIDGWVIGEDIIYGVKVIINGIEYVCDRVERADVTAAFPNYNTTKAGFSLKINATHVNNGSNSLIIRAYISEKDYVEIYNGSFNAIKLQESYVDWCWYYLKYHNTDSEIASIGFDALRLIEHYYAKGIAKGYSPCVGFDPVWYYTKNTDIKPNVLDAYKHFVMFCLPNNELRQCSPYLALKYYKNNNGDLSKMTAEELFFHYMYFGCRESRIGNDTYAAKAFAKMFNAKEYAENNGDLKKAFGLGENIDSNNSLWTHWIVNGINEKRIFSDDFNMSYYMKKYGISNAETAFWRYLNSGYANGEITRAADEPATSKTPSVTPVVSAVPSQKPVVSSKPSTEPVVSKVPSAEPVTSTLSSPQPITTVQPGNLDNNTPQIIVSKEYGSAGDEIPVTICIKNNPGITSLSLGVQYDQEHLTLQSVKNEGLMSGATFMTGNNLASNPYKLIWNIGTQDVASDGTLVTLIFKVKDGSANGTYPISVTYADEDIYNTKLEDVTFYSTEGSITLSDSINGDVNNDGKVNSKDVTLITQYVAGFDIEINEGQADVTGDNKINTKDATLLMQHLAGWNVELK